MNIKGMYVGATGSHTLEYKYCKQSNKMLKSDIQILPNKIKALNAKPGQRNKLKTSYGAWFVTRVNDLTYGVCTSQSYPERHAYGLIGKIREYVENKKNPADTNFLKQLKKVVNENCQKYQKLQNIDKVHKAQSEVNQLQGELNTGIRKLIDNQQDLKQLDQKADSLKEQAKIFCRNAQKLQSITFWTKWKMILIIVMVVLAAISGVVLLILFKR